MDETLRGENFNHLLMVRSEIALAVFDGRTKKVKLT